MIKGNLRSFWNQDRGVYEIYKGKTIVAEATRTNDSMRIIGADLEVEKLIHHLEMAIKNRDELIEAFPPEVEQQEEKQSD